MLSIAYVVPFVSFSLSLSIFVPLLFFFLSLSLSLFLAHSFPLFDHFFLLAVVLIHFIISTFTKLIALLNGNDAKRISTFNHRIFTKFGLFTRFKRQSRQVEWHLVGDYYGSVALKSYESVGRIRIKPRIINDHHSQAEWRKIAFYQLMQMSYELLFDGTKHTE